MARESTLGLSKREFGPLHPVGPKWESNEDFFIRGRFKKDDFDGIQSPPRLEAKGVTGYTWRDATIVAWGSGRDSSNATRLAIKATLEYSGPTAKHASLTDPLVGDLEITIHWPDDGTSNDPYQLLLVTQQLYPLP